MELFQGLAPYIHVPMILACVIPPGGEELL
jgi:hypothetical protein